jgi:hypothetical protein
MRMGEKGGRNGEKRLWEGRFGMCKKDGDGLEQGG